MNEQRVGDLIVQGQGRDKVYVYLRNSGVQIENQDGIIIVTAYCGTGPGRSGIRVCEIDPDQGIKQEA